MSDAILLNTFDLEEWDSVEEKVVTAWVTFYDSPKDEQVVLTFEVNLVNQTFKVPVSSCCSDFRKWSRAYERATRFIRANGLKEA
jgi:hypothetical protein